MIRWTGLLLVAMSFPLPVRAEADAGQTSSCSANCLLTSCTITCSSGTAGVAVCSCAWGVATCACGGGGGGLTSFVVKAPDEFANIPHQNVDVVWREAAPRSAAGETAERGDAGFAVRGRGEIQFDAGASNLDESVRRLFIPKPEHRQGGEELQTLLLAFGTPASRRASAAARGIQNALSSGDVAAYEAAQQRYLQEIERLPAAQRNALALFVDRAQECRATAGR